MSYAISLLNPVTKECMDILQGFEDRVILLPSLNQKEMAARHGQS